MATIKGFQIRNINSKNGKGFNENNIEFDVYHHDKEIGMGDLTDGNFNVYVDDKYVELMAAVAEDFKKAHKVLFKEIPNETDTDFFSLVGTLFELEEFQKTFYALKDKGKEKGKVYDKVFLYRPGDGNIVLWPVTKNEDNKHWELFETAVQEKLGTEVNKEHVEIITDFKYY
jgi:hypothetical protein